MLLKGFRKEIFRPECNPGFQSLHCHAHLDQDISEVLPYLNANLGGDQYVVDPPSVTFQVHGKLITVHARKIAVNALKDEQEANKIIEWLQREINSAWENRDKIKPRYEGLAKPRVLEILKLLPRTNCRECRLPTCMVFAAQMAEGVKTPGDCPPLAAENQNRLQKYLSRFKFIHEPT